MIAMTTNNSTSVKPCRQRRRIKADSLRLQHSHFILNTEAVARFRRDACFGELAVMTGEVRSATVVATNEIYSATAKTFSTGGARTTGSSWLCPTSIHRPWGRRPTI